MRNAIRVVGVAVAVVLCAASATGYQGSYKETNLGNGAFMVVVEVNEHTSYATARQYAFRRASEVCGASGFVVGGADGNSYGPTRATTVVGPDYATTRLSGGGHDFTLVYACNNGYDGSRPSGPGAGGAENLPRY